MTGKNVRFLEPPNVRLVDAIEKCDVRTVRQLLEEENVDVNALTGNDITPMHWACGLGDSSSHLQIIQLLLNHQGDPNIKSSDGMTPVHVAACWGFLPVLKLLMGHGGDPWLEDQEGCNAWDLALQKNQWTVLKYLTSYMDNDEEEALDPAEESVQCVFVKNREVDLASSMSSNNLGFLGSESALSSSSSSLNAAVCQSVNSSTASSVVVVEERIYSDAKRGVNLVEWHYPPLVQQNSVTDATLNEALCSSKEDEADSYMDSQLLANELRLLGETPGPITPTTKQVYLRQLTRLRKLREAQSPHQSSPQRAIRGHYQHSPQRLGISKELQALLAHYPGREADVKMASHLDRLLVTHFACSNPAKPWREGLAKKSFNYLLLDPRVTKNLALNESLLEHKDLFRRFITAVFYVGKGKQMRPHEHLYEAIKLRDRPQGFVKISKKVRRILDIWDEGHGVVSIHLFQNSLPVEAYCREAAMIEALGLSSITNAKRGDYYGVCNSWSASEKRLWGAHLLYKAFMIFVHEGERQIRPIDL